MPPEPELSPTPPTADPEWEARLRYWRRKLGRIRLGVEPVEVQVARYRRVTLVLTAIPAAIAVGIVTLFTAFQRPDVGAAVALILFAPLVALAWLDFGMLSLRASRYLRERAGRDDRGTPGGA